jgi:hypothetical protein
LQGCKDKQRTGLATNPIVKIHQKKLTLQKINRIGIFH